MNRILLLLFVIGISLQSQATIHNVEAGGGGFGNPAPYYSPQFIEINVGDTVLWTWEQGTHNVTSTSGPESFSSGDHTAPFQWSYVFTIEGVYDYECSLFDHADTQFGTITVGSPDGVASFDSAPLFTVYPNPVVDVLTIATMNKGTIELTDVSGRLIAQYQAVGSYLRIDKSDLPSGLVFIKMHGEQTSWTETIVVR